MLHLKYPRYAPVQISIHSVKYAKTQVFFELCLPV